MRQESHGTVVVPREPSFSRRAAKSVVKMARQFQSDILFTFGDIHIDAKSTLMAFILLEALKGQTVEVSARGSDSAMAVRNLSQVFLRHAA
jgi:phosphotransferase system HPr (HPr) family protein